MKTNMQINPKFATPILVLAGALSESRIPFTLNVIWDGLQMQFPWNDGDIVCHSGSYGHDDGNVESMGCPWDEDDVTCLNLDEAFENIEKWYAEFKHNE